MISLRFCFSYSLSLSGFAISPLRVYFSQYVWLRKLFLQRIHRGGIIGRVILSPSTSAWLCPFFFPRLEFKGRRLTEVEIWTHARASVSMLCTWELQISSGRNRRDALLVCKSVAERIEVTNWNARCVSSRSLRRFSRATRKDIVVGASIKYATIYAARWVRIYALIPTMLVSNHCEWFYQWKRPREFIVKHRMLGRNFMVYHIYAAVEFFDNSIVRWISLFMFKFSQGFI